MITGKLTSQQVECLHDLARNVGKLTTAVPYEIANALNELFKRLDIPAEVIGWLDTSDDEHAPCGEDHDFEEPCREYEEAKKRATEIEAAGCYYLLSYDS